MTVTRHSPPPINTGQQFYIPTPWEGVYKYKIVFYVFLFFRVLPWPFNFEVETMKTSPQYTTLKQRLLNTPYTWTVTGVAGFIGSNLLEALLKHNQTVVGLDNFSTGHPHNLHQVKGSVSAEQWSRFRMVTGDIRDLKDCRHACAEVDYVLHQAALGSVPRSLEDPLLTNENNITGFINMLVTARDAGVRRFVYAASSSTYGDHPGLPKAEDVIGKPLSPYAVTKYVNELYADVFARCYGFKGRGKNKSSRIGYPVQV